MLAITETELKYLKYADSYNFGLALLISYIANCQQKIHVAKRISLIITTVAKALKFCSYTLRSFMSTQQAYASWKFISLDSL